ncbi:hypothetical protein BN946_scf184605.g4 [Trametes cinnabarina]|uniref:DUF6534 domain-containing protein n=1 Tax=Pycnoporus cinnabarinus TaxID=5643 RepID=A0A060SRH6_PYCCI|nr:hypothetical protein BN946_scf184605.g4 [Trametes cinnabarina]
MAALSDAPPSAPPSIAALAALLDLENTFGAYLVCTCLGCMLFGLTTHQTYRYFRLYPSDPWSLKSLVLIVLFLDIMHTILSIHICYFYLVTNYFHPERLAAGVWSIRLIILNTGLVILCSHCFYARRLFFLSNRNLIPVVVIVSRPACDGDRCVLSYFLPSHIALSKYPVILGFSIAAAYESFVQVTFERFIRFSVGLNRPAASPPVPWLIMSMIQYLLWTVLSCAVAVDCVATGTLTYYLRKSRTGFKRTDSMVDILMVYTVNTGLSTSIISMAALICAITMKDNLIYSAMITVGTKMYSNSLLAVLNSRRSLVDKGMEGFETGSFGLRVIEPPEKAMEPRDVRPISFVPTSPRMLRNGRGIDVKVTTETFVDISAQNEALRNSGEDSERK